MQHIWVSFEIFQDVELCNVRIATSDRIMVRQICEIQNDGEHTDTDDYSRWWIKIDEQGVSQFGFVRILNISEEGELVPCTTEHVEIVPTFDRNWDKTDQTEQITADMETILKATGLLSSAAFETPSTVD